MDGEVWIALVEVKPHEGHSIFTQADSLDELRAMVRDAVSCSSTTPTARA